AALLMRLADGAGHRLRPHLLAALRVVTEYEPFALGGREHVDPILHDDRRRPAAPGYGRLEDDVLFGPVDWHVLVGNAAGAGGAPEARPVGGSRQHGDEEEDEGGSNSHSTCLR